MLNTPRTTASADGLTLVTGLGRVPMTRNQVARLSRTVTARDAVSPRPVYQR